MPDSQTKSISHLKIKRAANPEGSPVEATAPSAGAVESGSPGGGEGGRGGVTPPALPRVTNADFVEAIFRDLPDGARPVVLGKPADPEAGGWPAFDAGDVESRCRDDTNNYMGCSSIFPGGDGSLRAAEGQAAAYHALVLDDVGTKTPLDALPDVAPTWMLETSTGNYQVGFRLSVPATDFAAVKQAQKRIFAAGIGDKGAGNVVRWVRLPNGINGKASHLDGEGKPFRCRLIEWHPDTSYDLAELVELLAPRRAVDGSPAQTVTSTSVERSDTGHPGIATEVFLPASAENPVVTALKRAGLYKREVEPGRHEVSCPWRDEHTGGADTGACFFEPSRSFPVGGFKCHHSHGDKYRLRALLERFGLSRRVVHNRPTIRIVEGELQAMVDAAQVVLAETGEFFQAGGLVVKVVVDSRTGAASIQPQTDADLTLALSRAADWERHDEKGGLGRWRRCNPHPNCIRLLLQAQEYRFLPALRGIARQPIFNGEDRLISVAGYDPVSQLYCAFNPQKYARPDPSEENAREALHRLKHLLREFHFATDRDRSTAVSALFTAVLRPCLGRAPAFHGRAPSPGSGKSLLCDVISRFAGPGEPAKVSFPRTEEEATKVVLAALLQAPAVIDFDDMSTDWRAFGAINRLLTSSTMTDRILGASKMATVSTDTLVLGSGNNTGPTGDLNRRVLVIDLDSRSESPALLQYEGDPLALVEANREAFVADVLLIVEAWIAAGRPRDVLTPIATYGGRWTDFCRQPLVWLGLDDPAEGLIHQLREDPDVLLLGRFLAAWFDLLGSKAVTLRALLEAAEGDLLEAVENLPFAEGGPINRSKFGHYLRRNAGRPVAGFRLEKADSRERNAWRVVSVEVADAATPPLPPSPPSTDPDADRPSFD